MRKRGGILGPKKTVTASSAVGFWDLTTLQQELGAATWPTLPVFVNYLVVAGGGAGGKDSAGGGGAGGLRSTVTATGGGGSLESPLQLAVNTNYTVTVGAGAATTSGSIGAGVSGSNSVFATITSTGGGGGGGWNGSGLASGLNGGSGGGGGGLGTAAQGFDGAASFNSGAGGAGAVGAVSTVNINGTGAGGAGGAGVASSITGSSVTYAGGGGGAGDARGTNPGGAGGSGGGGAGGQTTAGTAGTANTGGGGGGGPFTNPGAANGGAGGSGVVILRYSNLYTLNIGAGLSYSTQTVNDDKVTTFTSGSGSISLSPAPVTTGDYESIAAVLVGSAGASSITFSNIPQTYKHLQIRVNYSANTTNDNTHIRFNGDTSASYSWHEMYGSSSESIGSVVSGNYGGTLVTTAKFGYVGSTSAGFTGVGTSDILDYTNTNKIKVARHLVGTHTNGSASYVLFRSVAWHNTGAITSITIYSPPGLITQHSHFALYGIRG